MNLFKKIKLNKKSLLTTRQGMSFMEVIIGIFIFALIMLSLAMIFTSSFGGYRKADKMQKNIEDVHGVMNQMAKSLRTSKIINQTSTEILAYDFSQKLCNRFTFSTNKIELAYGSRTYTYVETIDCSDVPLSTSSSITGQYVSGSFVVSPSVPPSLPSQVGSVGKVTINIKVCSDQNCSGAKNDQAILQTTVSLRDYETVDL